MEDLSIFKPKPGALRYTEWDRVHQANPKDPSFVRVSKRATEYWDGGSWKPVSQYHKE